VGGLFYLVVNLSPRLRAGWEEGLIEFVERRESMASIIINLRPMESAKEYTDKFVGIDQRYVSHIPIPAKLDVFCSNLCGKQYVPNATESKLFIASTRRYQDNYVLGNDFEYISLPSRSVFVTHPDNYFCTFVEKIRKYQFAKVDINEQIRVYAIAHPVEFVVRDLEEYKTELYEQYKQQRDEIMQQLGAVQIKEQIQQLNIDTKIRYKDIVPPPEMTKAQFVKQLRQKYGQRLTWKWILEYPENYRDQQLSQRICKRAELEKEYQEIYKQANQAIENLPFLILEIDDIYLWKMR